MHVWPPVAACRLMLGIVGSNLTTYKLEQTTPNMFQYVTMGWPNTCNMLHPTILGYAALKRCNRLARALEFK